MLLVVGLGNPGKQYERTRHSIGREILLAWQKKEGLADFEFNKKFNALISKNKNIILLLPETFVNKSGAAVGLAARFFKIKPENVIVIHDDADIEFGRIKLSFNRSASGHKGVESVKRALKTEKYWRLRVGIQKRKRVEAMKLVLQKFTPAEENELKKLRKKIFEGLEIILKEGTERAMNFLNQN
jgi:PTH1 family peptidyl-tRNA hydrolase